MATTMEMVVTEAMADMAMEINMDAIGIAVTTRMTTKITAVIGTVSMVVPIGARTKIGRTMAVATTGAMENRTTGRTARIIAIIAAGAGTIGKMGRMGKMARTAVVAIAGMRGKAITTIGRTRTGTARNPIGRVVTTIGPLSAS